MIYYLMTVLSLLLGRAKLSYTINGKKKFIKVFWIIGIILIILCGFRSLDIGRDTRSVYYYTFKNFSNIESLARYYGGTDYLYFLVVSFFSRFFDFRTFMIFCAFVSIFPVLFVIDKYSDDSGLSLALYIMFGYYTFCFSGMRQALAMGICFLAFYFSCEKKIVPYLICMICAIFIHFTALLFLPVYWIDKIPYKKITLVIIAVSSAIVISMRNDLISIAQNFVRVQEGAGYVGSNRMIIFMVLSIVLGVVFFRKNNTKVEGIGKTLLYTQIISCLIGVIATSFNNGWTRMYYYYHIFLALYIPFLLKQIKDKKVRVVVYCGFVIVGFYLIWSQICNDFVKLNPYSMF